MHGTSKWMIKLAILLTSIALATPAFAGVVMFKIPFPGWLNHFPQPLVRVSGDKKTLKVKKANLGH